MHARLFIQRFSLILGTDAHTREINANERFDMGVLYYARFIEDELKRIGRLVKSQAREEIVV